MERKNQTNNANGFQGVSDMELMRKMMQFMRKARLEMGGQGIPGMGRPGMGMPPMPPHGPHGYVKREHRMQLCGDGNMGMARCDEHRRYEDHPAGHGRHGRRPPLSREHLLIMIGKHPEGIRQKAICEEIGINQSSVSELIDKLEGNGYIKRETDPADRRATLLFLTELGQARAAEVEDERQEMFRGIFDRLSAEEKQTLAELLDKLLAAEGEVKEL